jgi:predicted nucleic acid-binding protein
MANLIKDDFEHRRHRHGTASAGSASSVEVLLPTSRHAAILVEVIVEMPNLRGNILHEFHAAMLMREHGIRDIYTRDTDFSRFPFVSVIGPAG